MEEFYKSSGKEKLGEMNDSVFSLSQEDDDQLRDCLMDLVQDDGEIDSSVHDTEQEPVTNYGDKCGPTKDITESEMRQAFALVPEFEKREYEIAVEEVPHLVETETPWEDFLWTEDENTYLTALRIARYWKARKGVFGVEHWLRPLNQTGSGALWAQDIELLRSGFLVMLMRPSGGIVGIMDFSMLPPHTSEGSIIRYYFYLALLFAKESQKGYTLINVESGKTCKNPLTLEAQAILEVCFPLKVRRAKLFVVQACFKPGCEALLDFATFQGEQILRFTTKNTVNRILGSSVREAQEYIQNATGGIERECLPLSIGGTFDYSIFDQWLQDRVTIEFSQIPLPTSTVNAKLNNFVMEDRGARNHSSEVIRPDQCGKGEIVSEDDNSTIATKRSAVALVPKRVRP